MRRHGKKLIIVMVLALLASMLSGFGFFQKKQEDYRTIRVYKLDGTATVEREELGSLEAYEGMLLRSGDIVKTPAESWLYFQMDEDKYSMLEPESLLRIEASGTSADSKTYLSLEYGSLAFRVDNKLSADSVYEINTPNSTMAIRGTSGVIETKRQDLYLVEGSTSLEENEPVYKVNQDVKCIAGSNTLPKGKGAAFTRLMVSSGTVSSRLKEPDGSISKNEKLVSAGNFATMRIDSSSSVYLGDGKLDYTKEPFKRLEFLLTAGIGVKSPDQNEELEKAYEELKKQNHTHTGGIATCVSPAVCDKCSETYGEKDPYFHAETELRNQETATCRTTGYTGDRYCTGCNQLLENGSVIPKSATNHVGGTEVRNTVTADCMNKGYTGDTYCKGCGGIVSKGKATDKFTTNHVGGTEVRNAKTADCMNKGYTGDTYCTGCGKLLQSGSSTDVDLSNHIGEEVIQDDKVATCHTEGYTGNVYCNACGYRVRSGSSIPFDATNHDGGLYENETTKKVATCCAKGHNADIYCYGCGKLYSDGGDTDINPANHDGTKELRDVKAATCKEKGYTGNYYCSGCNAMLESGSYTDLDPTNHEGGTYVETVQAPTCCSNGYGNTRCSGCGAVLASGTSIPATGAHTPAACGVTGHCVYDGKTHEIPGCCIDGHCVSDGKDHSQASCGIYGHYTCDGNTHGSNCSATDPTGSPDAVS